MNAARCIWCGAPGELATVALRVPNNYLAGEVTGSFAVHSEHEPLLREFVTFLQRSKRPFVFLLGVALCALPLATILAVALDLPGRIIGIVVGTCTSLVGGVFVAFPFPTPETVNLLGINRARRLVRVVGLMIAITGIGLAFFVGP